MKKTGLTMTRHREIGLELAAIQDRLATLATEVANAYPLQGPRGRFGRGLDRLRRVLTEVRSAGDDAMWHEHGHLGDGNAYYPTQDVRQAYLAQFDADALTAYRAES